jgi:hypothetical protein
MSEQPFTELTAELSEIRVNPFNVHVDIVELLRLLDGDQSQMFDLLGRLKDFLQ